MPNIAVLNSQRHQSLKVEAGPLAATDSQHFVQVVLGEFPLLALHYPILFSKDADTGQFFAGAVLGLDPGENLFLNDREAYRPLNLQRGAFFVSGDELAIDLDHPRVGTPGGEPLFTADGAPTPYTQNMAALFRELRPGIPITKAFIDKLIEFKLIEPIDINNSLDDGVTRRLQGLYTINKEALGALADAHVVELFRHNYLQAIYLMIASLKQIPVLAKKKNRALLPPDAMTGRPA